MSYQIDEKTRDSMTRDKVNSYRSNKRKKNFSIGLGLSKVFIVLFGSIMCFGLIGFAVRDNNQVYFNFDLFCEKISSIDIDSPLKPFIDFGESLEADLNSVGNVSSNYSSWYEKYKGDFPDDASYWQRLKIIGSGIKDLFKATAKTTTSVASTFYNFVFGPTLSVIEFIVIFIKDCVSLLSIIFSLFGSTVVTTTLI